MDTAKAIQLLHRLQDEQFDGEYGDERREALSMAVRALEQNLVKESGDLVQDLVNDCISRKMAIDEVKRLHDVAWANWKETRISANTMIDALKDLPSEQPERQEQPESAKEYCAECNHIEMCRWYPYEGCEFRSLPSAQPETHEERTETHECDLISRQAAIDALKSQLSDWNDDYNIPVRKSIENIERLPSAQPDLDEWCTDCKEYDDKRHCCPRWNRVIRQALKDAQPERKKGKWITDTKYYEDGWQDFYYVETRCSVCGVRKRIGWYDANYCPNCGADMRQMEDDNE